jgi:hypothetical protein
MNVFEYVLITIGLCCLNKHRETTLDRNERLIISSVGYNRLVMIPTSCQYAPDFLPVGDKRFATNISSTKSRS